MKDEDKISYSKHKIQKENKSYLSFLAWLWVAIEPVNKVILGIRISFERNMLTAEQFLKNLVKKYGKHPPTFYGWWYLVSTSLYLFENTTSFAFST